MTAWYLVSLALKRSDIVDIAWGLGFVMLALMMTSRAGASSVRVSLIAGLVIVWGLRLAIHIAVRNRGKREDFRYAAWRRDWGKWFLLRSYLQVFMLQGLFMLLIAAPLIAVGTNAGAALGVLDALGVALWTVGISFEAIGDAQLSAFKANAANKGRIMRTGLWGLTRHPNYFGEVALGWAVWLVSLGSPLGPYAVVGPLTITWLLLKVSGIPMLERKYEGNAEFEAYKTRTSAFFPLPPRKA
jgi:steroid 5-alpha reductase family enzyme